jgi:lysyl-tRNA synthetase class 2
VSFFSEQQRLQRIRPNLEQRALIFQYTRAFFAEHGFLEVDTPVRVPAIAPEEHIIPYESEGWFLSTSPELHMKRLMASGYDRLFQLSRCFRKGESGKRHNPEFTMLEWYRAGADYRDVIADTESLLVTISRRLGLGLAVPAAGGKIDATPPWPRRSIRDAFLGTAGWDPISAPDPVRFDTDLVTRVVPALPPDRPAVLEGYPASMAALAKINARDPRAAERAEIFLGGLELANAYSELNDPAEQKRRFEEEAERIRKTGGRATVSRVFLEAIERLPECAGIALGMDRLAMLFCGADSIDEVMAFPADEA